MSSSWIPNKAEIATITILLTALVVIHYIYGIRFRCTKLSQSKQELAINVPLLTALSTSTTSTIKILSQNVWCVFLRGGRKRRQRLKILIHNIKVDNPDIICLQEMHILGLGFLILCGDYIYVKNSLHKLGYFHHTDPKLSTPYFGSSSGCVIFSKYPITNSITNTFENRRTARYKGWLYAHISIANTHGLKLINTHLEHKDFDIRFEQMKEIAHGIDNKILDDSKASILCVGDFNVCSNFTYGGNGYNLLVEQMGNVGLNVDLYGNTDRTYSKAKQRQGTKSFDHCFIDEGSKKFVQKCQVVDYRNDERIMSDHLGLLTTFQF